MTNNSPSMISERLSSSGMARSSSEVQRASRVFDVGLMAVVTMRRLLAEHGWTDSSNRTPLPSRRSRFALERSDDLGGDPAAVEAARLRGDSLTVDAALVHQRRVEGDVAADRSERGRRVEVSPGGVRRRAVGDGDGEVGGDAFPLAGGPAR